MHLEKPPSFRRHVAVTGATGHLGLELTKQLLAEGHRVTALVRSAEDQRAYYLQKLGATTLVGDLLDRQSLLKAFSGANAVFHAGAVYRFSARDPLTEIYRPNLEGTKNVLSAVQECRVDELIFTSSTVAVGTNKAGEVLDETSWNQDPVDTYARAKVDAERLAFQETAAAKIRFTSLVPGVMLGPGFLRPTPTTEVIAALVHGKLLATLPLEFSFVDVRDVAAAHVKALDGSHSGRRYLLSEHSRSMLQLAAVVSASHPSCSKPPSLHLPRSILFAAPALDCILHQLTGSPRLATRDFVREFRRGPQRYDSSLAKTDLGFSPRPFEKSVLDTVDWVHNNPSFPPSATPH